MSFSEAFFIQQINTDHINQCLVIENAAKKTRSNRSEKELLEFLENYLCFGIFENDKLIGFAFFSRALDEAELLDVTIAKDKQNGGIGSYFLEQSFQTLKQKHYICTIILEVAINNISAIKAYQKFNYQQIGVRKNYYQNTDGSKTDALVYKITL
ncbi:MAG TPA: alanine acetyltransferase [Alphaproteobacteria bacterium]|nr:alanine acetyltransferase [Alphaproteobacteria bacterium]